MKLKSMLLPTGEFVLILTEAPVAYAEWAADFKERTGAVAMLITTEPVEVENAVYDVGARRRDELSDAWQDLDSVDEVIHDENIKWGTEYIAQFAKLNREQEQIFADDGDALLIRAYDAGAEFSPAGLVKDGPKSTLADWERELLLDPFTPGTRVEIIGDSLYHYQKNWPGTHGVVREPYMTPPEDSIFVESEVEDESGYINRWFFPRSSLQPVPAILEYTADDSDLLVEEDD